MDRGRIFKEISDLIYRDPPSDRPLDLVDAAFRKLPGLVSSKARLLIRIDPLTFALDRGYEANTDPLLMTEYLAHYQRYDPFVIETPCLRQPNKAVRFRDFIDYAAIDRTEFADLMHRAQFRHAIAVVPFVRGVPLGVVAMHRSRQEGEFSNEEAQDFEWFANHLAHGLDRMALLRGKVDSTPTAVLLPSGTLVSANDEFRRLLDSSSGEQPLELPREDQKPQAVALGGRIWTIRTYSLENTSLLATPGAGAIKSLPLLRRLERRLRVPSPAPSQPFRVVLHPVREPDAIEARLAGLHLTPTEQKVAWLSLQGLTNKEMADKCEVREATIKEHLTSIYRKAGVRNRASFVAKMVGVHP